MGIKGRHGLDLGEDWKDGVKTFLGMTVAGFPNMYIVYGPQGECQLPVAAKVLEMLTMKSPDITHKWTTIH